MKNLFTALSAVFGIIPGAVVLMTGITVPVGYKLLFGGVIEALCCLIILYAYIRRESILKYKERKSIQLLKKSGAVFLIGLMGYIILYNYSIYEDDYIKNRNPDAEASDYTVIYPLVLTGTLDQLVWNSGGRQKAILEHTAPGVNEVIKDDPLFYSITIIIFLFLYAGIFCSLTHCFSLLAVRSGNFTLTQGSADP